jgi:P2-related tail formation protein
MRSFVHACVCTCMDSCEDVSLVHACRRSKSPCPYDDVRTHRCAKSIQELQSLVASLEAEGEVSEESATDESAEARVFELEYKVKECMEECRYKAQQLQVLCVGVG